MCWIGSNFKLYVPGLENVFYSPQDQTVREGKGVFFQCVSGESSPPAHITWLKDGTLVQRGRQVKVRVYIPAEQTSKGWYLTVLLVVEKHA